MEKSEIKSLCCQPRCKSTPKKKTIKRRTRRETTSERQYVNDENVVLLFTERNNAACNPQYSPQENSKCHSLSPFLSFPRECAAFAHWNAYAQWTGKGYGIETQVEHNRL